MELPQGKPVKQDSWADLIPSRSQKMKADRIVIEMRKYPTEHEWLRNTAKAKNTDLSKIVVALIRAAMIKE